MTLTNTIVCLVFPVARGARMSRGKGDFQTHIDSGAFLRPKDGLATKITHDAAVHAASASEIDFRGVVDLYILTQCD